MPQSAISESISRSSHHLNIPPPSQQQFPSTNSEPKEEALLKADLAAIGNLIKKTAEELDKYLEVQNQQQDTIYQVYTHQLAMNNRILPIIQKFKDANFKLENINKKCGGDSINSELSAS